MNSESLFQKDITINDLVELMEQECDRGADVFAIDHLHYFAYESKDRLDQQIKQAMHAINEVARKRNVAVFLIAHYKNSVNDSKPHPSDFRDASAIKQVANVIIQITRDWHYGSVFHITKMRWPIEKCDFECGFDIDMYEYSFTKSEKQKVREKDALL